MFSAAVGLVALFASSATSAVLLSPIINVDFQSGNNTYSGQGVLGSASDTLWNSVSSLAANLLFVDGSGASGASVSVTGFVGNAANGSQVNPILNDWVYGLSNVMTITIGGLAANSAFDLAFYNGFYWQDYTISGQAGLLASTRPDSSISSAGAPPFTADKYAILQNVMSDSIGVIAILDTPLTGGRFGLSSEIAGLQIQQLATVPEPTTTALLVLGLLGAGFARRRKH
jgi:hypothetical protein